MRINYYLMASLASVLMLSGCAGVPQDLNKKEVLCPFTGMVAGGAVGGGASSGGILAPVGAYVGGMLADYLCNGDQEKDSDGDGVMDKDDQCQATSSGVMVNDKGCDKDADMDGVDDVMDLCLGTPKGAMVDSNGCAQDTDMDGVADHMDQCPGTPKDMMVDDLGCVKDMDMDGVPDQMDQCPGTPANTRVDNVGCVLPVFVVEDKCAPYVTVANNYLINAKPVLFASGSSKVDGEGQKILQCIVDAAKGTLSDLDVAGYTDSVGSVAANNRLSKRRAENVYSILVKKGFDKDKLRVIGFGMTDPVSDNSSANARAQNRRVEIRPRY